MTVALGLVCKDGVLVASDSMGSDGTTATAAKTQKVRCLDRCPMVWTGAGSVYTMEEVTTALQKVDTAGTATDPPKAFTKPDLNAVRSMLTNSMRPALQSAYDGALTSTPMPPGAIHPGFMADFLMLGYASGTPWLLELYRDGQLNWHTDRKFYAIGSGGAFANVAMALMLHYVSDDLTLEHGKLVAYRTIDTTIEVSMSAVGPPVQIAVCDSSGSRVLTDDEIDQLRDGVDRWKTLERESLQTLEYGSLEDGATQPAIQHDLPAMPEQHSAAD